MKQYGFTIIELIIVLTIITLIFSFASPSYRFIINQFRIQSDVSNLLMMIRMTRQHAVVNMATTVLCPTSDDSQCTRNWKLPLIQFVDKNKNKKRDPEEAIEKRFKAFDGDDVFIKYPKTQIRFNEYGMANFYNGTVGYCLDEHMTGIVISRLGRIRFAQDIDEDEIPDVNATTQVSCK